MEEVTHGSKFTHLKSRGVRTGILWTLKLLSGVKWVWGAKLWDPGYKALKNLGPLLSPPQFPPPSSLASPQALPVPLLQHQPSPLSLPLLPPLPSALIFSEFSELWLMIGPTGYEVLEDRTLISLYL